MPESKRQRAYQLGAVDAYAGRPLRDMDGEESAWLMAELGETSATTAANQPRRLALCEAYEDGWHDARKAIGPTVDLDALADELAAMDAATRRINRLAARAHVMSSSPGRDETLHGGSLHQCDCPEIDS